MLVQGTVFLLLKGTKIHLDGDNDLDVDTPTFSGRLIPENCFLQALRSSHAYGEEMHSTETFTAIPYHGIWLKTHRLEVLDGNSTGTFNS